MRAAGRLREAQRRPGGRGRGRGTEPGETRWSRGGGRNSASFPPALPAGSEQAPRRRSRPLPPLRCRQGAVSRPGGRLGPRQSPSPPRRAARYVLGLAAPFPPRMGQSLVEVTARRVPGPLASPAPSPSRGAAGLLRLLHPSPPLHPSALHVCDLCPPPHPAPCPFLWPGTCPSPRLGLRQLPGRRPPAAASSG